MKGKMTASHRDSVHCVLYPAQSVENYKWAGWEVGPELNKHNLSHTICLITDYFPPS